MEAASRTQLLRISTRLPYWLPPLLLVLNCCLSGEERGGILLLLASLIWAVLIPENLGSRIERPSPVAETNGKPRAPGAAVRTVTETGLGAREGGMDGTLSLFFVIKRLHNKAILFLKTADASELAMV